MESNQRARLLVSFAMGVVFSGSAVAWASVAASSVFPAQWAWKNAGQKVCDNAGANCQAGKRYADVQALNAWKLNHDCSNAVVAILDTGIDYGHPDLKAAFAGGRNFVGANAADPFDDNAHGSHVAGTIAGAGSAAAGGAAGVCARARVLAVKVGDYQGALADSDIIAGIDYAAAQGSKVVNASFGGGGASQAMQDAIHRASKTLFVIAAGNGDPWTGRGYSIDTNPTYPASYPEANIIVVAATDNRDQLGSFSNYGAKTVHLAAPGVNILSTTPLQATVEMRDFAIPTTYAYMDGTSMATPHVTGAVALYWSAHPTQTAAQVKARLLASVEPVAALKGKTMTGGRLNLARLLK